MRKTRSMALAAFVVTIGSAWLVVAQEQTLKGELVDTACYKEKSPEGGGTGQEHTACALTCAQKGDSLAVLTDDGLFIITGDFTKDKNAKLIDFVAKNVEAKGVTSLHDNNRWLALSSISLLKK